MNPTPRAAALLLRISDDRAGDAAGVGRQEKDGLALAERLGWNVVLVVTENDTSAFKRRTVSLPDGSTAMRVFRPKFRNLLDLMTSGEIDGLIAYDLDRVARDPRDLEDLIDVVESKKVPVESVTGSLRLANDSDVTMARVMVAVANKSSRDTSRRLIRKHEQLADEGKYAGGVRRFGFQKNGVDHVPDEARCLRWCAEQVLDGRTVSSLARELDDRGVRPVKAKQWSAKTLSDLLISPRVAGLRVFHGEVVGSASWQPIIDADTHEMLKAVIASRGRGRTQPALVQWCNGLLFCGRCGHALSGSSAGPGRPNNYWCNSRRGGCGKLSILAPKTEAEIGRHVLEYLKTHAASFARSSNGFAARVDRPKTPVDVSKDQDLLGQLAAMLGRNEMSLSEWRAASAPIKERIAAAQPVVVLPAVQPAVRATMTALARGNAEDQWKALSPEMKREVTRAILFANGDKGWTVSPADTSKARRFDPSRLSLTAG